MAAKSPVIRDFAKTKEEERKGWSESAPSWRKYSAQWMAMTREVSEAIVSAAQINSGMQVLDLASGTGEPALTVARRVGPKGHVAATDFSYEMLRCAEALARKQGLLNLTFGIADAENLPFKDKSFDAVTCRFGINFFADPDRALSEIHRMLKPNGCVGLVVWGLAEDNPYLRFFWEPLRKYVTSKKYARKITMEFEDPELYELSRPGTLKDLLRHGGFVRVKERFLPVRLPWPGPPEEVFEWYLDEPEVQEIIGSIPPGRRARAIEEILELPRRHYDGREVSFPGVVVLASGVRGAE